MTPNKQTTGNGTVPAVEVMHFDPNTIRINPQAMRMLTVATGRTMEQLMASEEPADKFQAMAFFELRRRHPELGPDALWELAGTIDIELGDTTTADPFGTGSATVAPPSPTTGGSTPTPSTT